jgi:hypothetical protein
MKVSKLSKLTTLVLLSITSYQANAMVYLVDDAQAYIQDNYANMQRMIESSKELVYLKTQLESLGTFAEMTTDTVNNGFANVVARLDKGQEEKQNLEQIEKGQPAGDACATVTLAAGISDAECASVDQIEQLAANRARRSALATGGGSAGTGPVPSVQDINEENTKAAKAWVTECLTLNGLCEKSGLLFSPPGGTLNAQEYRAVQLQADLQTDIRLKVPEVAGLQRDTPEFKRALVQDLRRENMLGGLRAANENILILLNGTLVDNVRKPGRVELYQTYMNDRMGSPEWMCEVTNSCTGSHAYVPPDELKKREIQLDAVLLDIKLKQYESQLRTESYVLGMNKLMQTGEL